MSGSSLARREPESIGDFMKRRLRELAPEQAVAKAHELYGKAIRAGEDLDLPTARDVIEFGSKVLRGPPAPLISNRPVVRATPKATVVSAAPRRPSGPQPSPRTEKGNPLDRNPYAKAAAGYAGLVAGNIVGPYRAGAHAVQDLADTAQFVGRLTNPFDVLLRPPGESAVEELAEGGMRAFDYGKRVAADPHKLVDDARNAGHKLNVDLNPLATLQADTLGGEFRRTLGIGMNQGELAANVALFAAGGEAAATSKTLRGISKLKPTEYLESAHPDVAQYLSKPYEGKGHHSILPERIGKNLGNGKVARFIRDNPLFNVTFKGLTQGEGYGVHAAIDPYATHFRVRNNLSTRSWNARKAGIQSQHGLEQIWNGTPEAMKTSIAGVAGGAYGLAREAVDQEESW
jgi:hypothetical protein